MKMFTRASYVGVSRALTIFSVMAAAGFAAAEWPTSFQDLKVLGTGTGLRAMGVLALEDGGAVAVYDSHGNEDHQIMMPRFNADGVMTQPGTAIPDRRRAENLFVYPDTMGDDGFYVASYHPRPSVTDTTLHNVGFSTHIRDDGTWASTSNLMNSYDSALKMVGNRLYYFLYEFGFDALRMSGSLQRATLNGHLPTQADIVPTVDTYALASYTRSGLLPGVPTEIWLMATHEPLPPETTVSMQHARLADQPGTFQSDSQITPLADGNFMVNWLGEIDGQVNLYARVVSTTGSAVHPVRLIQEDVRSYKACVSPFEVPVHAFVQTNTSVSPAVDTLYGGLVDAATGNSVNLPLAMGLGMDVKAVRREASGDFSLIYSVVEGGTTLLKVRRISGVSAATLWETTVADLGSPSAEYVKQYPNVSVSGGNDALYFVTRKHLPYSGRVEFQMARLRGDGLLGGE